MLGEFVFFRLCVCFFFAFTFWSVSIHLFGRMYVHYFFLFAECWAVGVLGCWSDELFVVNFFILYTSLIVDTHIYIHTHNLWELISFEYPYLRTHLPTHVHWKA